MKVGTTYAIRGVFYLNTKFGDSGIAKLKAEETLKVVRVYLPKWIKQNFKLTGKLNKKIVHEKLRYEGFEFKGKTKIYRYKYTFEKIKPTYWYWWNWKHRIID